MVLKSRKITLHLLNPWVGYLFLATLVISIPLLVIFGNIFSDGGNIWQHITKNLLPGYVINTLLLMTGVALITFMIGVGAAWTVTMYRFPGHRIFQWLLILPIALPAYISGFTWAGILDYTSPVYVFMRNTFGIDTGQYLFFDILSLPGAVIIFSLSLYPYVYLLTRAYFLNQSQTLFEATASLGLSPWQTFYRVALPMARPAFVAGISLALMEVLNDYGLVKYFGVDTFTTGIFNAWFAFGNIHAAMKLSGFLMVFVLVLILIERRQRGKMRFDAGAGGRNVRSKKLKGWKALLSLLLVSLPFLGGFLLPFSMLIYWTAIVFDDIFSLQFLMLMQNSFLLAIMAAVAVVVVSVLVVFTVRTYPLRSVKIAARISTLGYALPGAVVAIGILVAFLWLETQMTVLSGPGFRLALVGTWFALVYAYLVRFMAIGYNSIESGNERIPVHLDHASRSLGVSKMKTLFMIILPLLKGSLPAAALLVFIDVLKELPLTLILRPFNFDTLAIRAFEYANDERLAEAAPAAIIIVIMGLIPVYLLNKMLRRSHI
jgi:iron(III) transport system permease protein